MLRVAFQQSRALGTSAVRCSPTTGAGDAAGGQQWTGGAANTNKELDPSKMRDHQVKRYKQVDAKPSSDTPTRFFMPGNLSPVYSGVARQLGYKQKNGGFTQ